MSKMSRELLDSMDRFVLEQIERLASRHEDRPGARQAAAGARG